MTTEDQNKMREDEIDALRSANLELLSLLKLFVIYSSQVSTTDPMNGISQLVRASELGLTTIRKFDHNFELSLTIENDTK